MRVQGSVLNLSRKVKLIEVQVTSPAVRCALSTSPGISCVDTRMLESVYQGV